MTSRTKQAKIPQEPIFGKLDIVASAEGKLIPQGYLKIVQPSEQGLIRDILVDEGQRVKARVIGDTTFSAMRLWRENVV
jgi:multidrug efflux pump subunit AcrA (membrane-fusion protein)